MGNIFITDIIVGSITLVVGRFIFAIQDGCSFRFLVVSAEQKIIFKI